MQRPVLVNLGSGGSIEIEQDQKPTFIFQGRKNLLHQSKTINGVYPKSKATSVSFEEEGVKFVSQSTPIQYVPLDSILDELPDFAVETLSNCRE